MYPRACCQAVSGERVARAAGLAAKKEGVAKMKKMSENDWLEVYVEMQKAAIKKMREKGCYVRMIPFSPQELCGQKRDRKVDLLQKADYIIFVREGQEKF